MIKNILYAILASFILLCDAAIEKEKKQEPEAEKKASIGENLLKMGSFGTREIAIESMDQILETNIRILLLMIPYIKDDSTKEDLTKRLNTCKVGLNDSIQKTKSYIRYIYKVIAYIDEISDELDKIYNELEKVELEEILNKEDKEIFTRLTKEDFQVLIKIIMKIKDRFRNKTYRYRFTEKRIGRVIIEGALGENKNFLTKDLQILRNEAMYRMLKNLIDDLSKSDKYRYFAELKQNSHIALGTTEAERNEPRSFKTFGETFDLANIKETKKREIIKDICNEISINRKLTIYDDKFRPIPAIIQDLYEYLYYFIDKLTLKNSFAKEPLLFKESLIFKYNWPRPTKEDYKYFDLKDNISNYAPKTNVNFPDTTGLNKYFLRRTYLHFFSFQR